MNLLSCMRYLVALTEHQHFGRAAQACHVTQPALSNAIRALEEEFNVVIVKRDRAYAGLTPEGERVLASAQYMLREHANLQIALQSQTDIPRGPLRIAAVPTAVPIATRFAAMLHARYPGIRPAVISLSSVELERGLDDLSMDMALGYSERLPPQASRLSVMPQYNERYFLLRRTRRVGAQGLTVGAPMGWSEAAALPLCLLTPDMHNRSIVEAAFSRVGARVQPALETNSIFTLMLSAVDGNVCSILPGALVDTVLGYGELEALPLVAPEVQTPIALISHALARPSLALESALLLARDPAWLRHAAMHSDVLQIGTPAASSA